jgi:hypothetical protein
MEPQHKFGIESLEKSGIPYADLKAKNKTQR